MNTPKLLAHTSLAAGVIFTATAEYSLARKMGAMEPVAVMLPVAIDAYAVAALKRFRSFDITLSLLLMGAAQVSAHLLDSHVMKVNGWLVVVVSLLVPVAIWRTHALARDDDQAPAEPGTLDVIQGSPTATVERVPAAPEAYPAIEAPVPAVPEAVPAGARLLPTFDCPGELRRALRHELPAPVLAAEYTRPRPEVRAEYVPEPATEPVPDWTVPGDYADEHGQPTEPEEEVEYPDPLIPKVRADFPDDVPGVRRLKETYSIGQPRAQRIRDELMGVRS
ncbi:hypothetical protein [Streptomyces sp. NPDC088350]|uniref:hypothetical protein n=1 Tax=Streptomyces sp. NPDC088350 TaxID=3365854 RepID=UPI0038196DDA